MAPRLSLDAALDISPETITPAPRSRGTSGNPRVSFNTRFQWWYASVSDWMLANPGEHLKNAVKENGGPINCSYSWLRVLTNTDLFSDYHERRRREYQARHDALLAASNLDLVHTANELILERLEKKRDSVPLENLLEIRKSALEGLGYGGKTQPQTVVNVNNSVDNRSVTVTAPSGALAEARQAIRDVEAIRQRQQELLPPVLPPISSVQVEEGVGDLEQEVYGDSVTIPSK